MASVVFLPGFAAAAEGPRVVTETAEPTEIIEVVPLDGTVSSLHTAALSVEIAGLVDAVLVETGDRITAGTPLFELDDELERLSVTSLEAERREAVAARQEAARRLEEARSVGAGRNIPETEVQARASAVRQAEARLARLTANLESGRARLDRHRLVAPFDGVVTERHAERGEWVDPGEALVNLVDRDALRLDYPVPQRYYPLLGENAVLDYRVDGSSMDWRSAEIVTVVPVTDPTSRTFLLRGQVTGATTLLPGMAVEGRLRLPTGREGLTVARDAVQRYPDGRTTVWVLDADAETERTVAERQVELAEGFDDRVVVTKGLDAGAQVIVRGNEALEAGMEVRIDDRDAEGEAD
ncbi:efflux RND transporter periplasmic adaptor subunit [Guyparkeria sp. TX1]|uniref:efflux RND transporter periplasmic adaptor subunit n=1 Tax=Guyparkeria sp. TX1 TaxID=3115001 RepID=UPI003977DAA8